jgi:hypothetical protein
VNVAARNTSPLTAASCQVSLTTWSSYGTGGASHEPDEHLLALRAQVRARRRQIDGETLMAALDRLFAPDAGQSR